MKRRTTGIPYPNPLLTTHREKVRKWANCLESPGMRQESGFEESVASSNRQAHSHQSPDRIPTVNDLGSSKVFDREFHFFARTAPKESVSQYPREKATVHGRSVKSAGYPREDIASGPFGHQAGGIDKYHIMTLTPTNRIHCIPIPRPVVGLMI